MKKIAKITIALLVANLCLPISAAENCFTIAEETDNVTIYSLYPTKDSVDGFFMMMDDADTSGVQVGDRALLNDEKNCYQLRTTPNNSSGTSIEDLWMYLYKDSNTGATHLAINEQVAELIGNDGGLGLTSAALADLDNDGYNEIYFTYSWDSGAYCSQVAYFDTKTEDVHYFGDHICSDSELILTAENNILTITKAKLTNYEDKVHYELEADKNIAEIVCNNGEIEVKSLSDDFVKLEEKLEPTKKPLPDWLPKNAEEADAFMDENGITRIGSVDTTTVVKDDMICSVINISVADSTKSDRICFSEKSDVKAPISYNVFKADHYGDYIVACFEMQPDSYLEIYDKRYYPEILGSYISDENGNVKEVCKGDVNKDGELGISDLVVLQRWILGHDESLDCWQLADICDDNQIDVYDMVMLRKLLT